MKNYIISVRYIAYAHVYNYTAYKLYIVQSAVFLIRFNTLFTSNCLFYYQ